MTTNPADLTIRQAADALGDGSLTSVALTEAVLARVEQTEPAINAYITVTADLARKQAADADADLQAGRDRGPLHGIPFALKDLYDTAGIPTTGGSGFLRDRVPTHDAFVVTKLREAGVVLTGKLNLHEFALGTSSNNPHYGPVRNPWDTARVPGGSSGGSAAALVVGSCLGTLGSDTGGSIRIPAALCGVVGLKPTYGRCSRRGVLPLSWSLDHVGPLARTVEDAALILNAIAGHDPDDPGSSDEPVDDYTADLGRDLRGLRVGLLRAPLWERCDDEVVAACEAALDVFRDLGATITDVSLPLLRQSGRSPVLLAEAAAYHHRWLRERPDDYGDLVRTTLEAASVVPATVYINAQRMRRRVIEETRALLRTVDVLVSPTTAFVAPPIDTDEPGFRLARLTAPYNLSGIPAISVPCGFAQTAGGAGLPIGLMIGARHFDEVTLCRVAHAYEQATPFHTQRPPI